MFRTVLGLCFVALLVAASGCTMCSHPFDCSGPVYSQDGSPSSGHSRAGSILAVSPQPAESVSQDQEPLDEPVVAAPARRKTQEEPLFSEPSRPMKRGRSVVADTTQSKTQDQPLFSEPSRPMKRGRSAFADATQPGRQEEPLFSEPYRAKTQSRSAFADAARPKTRGQSVSFDVVGGRVKGQVTGQVQTGDVPGSERIVSITDRVVKPAGDSTQPTETPQLAEDSSPESSKPLPSSGWTARRPTQEVLR